MRPPLHPLWSPRPPLRPAPPRPALNWSWVPLLLPPLSPQGRPPDPTLDPPGFPSPTGSTAAGIILISMQIAPPGVQRPRRRWGIASECRFHLDSNRSRRAHLARNLGIGVGAMASASSCVILPERCHLQRWARMRSPKQTRVVRRASFVTQVLGLACPVGVDQS